MNKFDVIIVGAGPSGIFCAYELTQKNRAKNILLIEQGKNIKQRACPIEKANKCVKCQPYCNITCGFSGAGAFSDGKLLSYHLSMHNDGDEMYLGGNGGSYIKNYYSNRDIKDLLTYTDNVYLNFGAEPHLEGIEHRDEIIKLQTKAKKEKLNLVDIPLRHLGTEKSQELYTKLQDYLEKNGINIMYDTTVKDIVIENGTAIGVQAYSSYDKDAQTTTYYADKIVMAVGRKGANWLSNICEKHNIKTEVGSVDIGVRYELSDEVMEKVNKLLYEGKFIARTSTYGDKVRTFCQNPSGFVSAEVYKDSLTLVNGHSYKDKKSKNTNLAILVSHHFNYPFNKPLEYGINVAENVNKLANGGILVQRLGDIYRGRRTWQKDLDTNKLEPTLKSAVAGDITYAIGYRTMTDILEFIKSVDKVVEGFANPENLLYAPEIKFYSNTVVVDKNFETNIKNLYSIGDGGGLTTGLMMASASGVQMARNLIQ
ncbi:MAG: NAD(P)/FAD-dependent oxidoreductase [Clostridia bacterium]|nr:NAD(P)/FAD-dependent oxidoreductase [Clostridia bacterium]